MTPSHLSACFSLRRCIDQPPSSLEEEESWPKRRRMYTPWSNPSSKVLGWHRDATLMANLFQSSCLKQWKKRQFSPRSHILNPTVSQTHITYCRLGAISNMHILQLLVRLSNTTQMPHGHHMLWQHTADSTRRMAFRFHWEQVEPKFQRSFGQSVVGV